MNTYLAIFLIICIGYMIGRIEIKGLGLGSSAILLTGLIFGHFGISIPGVAKNLGLVMFVASVGLITGPTFLSNFRKKALSYIILGFSAIAIASVVCVLCLRLMDIGTSIGIGLMCGALTSTPGLAAALEATQDTIASVGYGVAYVYGVLGVVLFVQIIPKLTKADAESLKAEEAGAIPASQQKKTIELSAPGFFALALTCVLGVLVGNIQIPLPGGVGLALGLSGGPLFVGLFIGALGHIGPISLQAPKAMSSVIRELGLILFLASAGTEAGSGFVAILKEQGIKLLIAGFFMTTVPMIVMYLVATKIFKIDVLNSLGAICGGMTSTPALGALINTAKTDAVAVSYAATYPVALICVVLSTQIINILCG